MRRALVALLVLCACATQPVTDTPWLTLSYAPGMIGDPWRMTIGEEGLVTLTVGDRTSRRRLSSAELRALRDIVAAARVDAITTRYSAPYSDLPTLRINEVTVYGPHEFCDRPDVRRFLSVWNAAVARMRPATAVECSAPTAARARGARTSTGTSA